jgi:tetratricopeptide (TPR) repeat protein
MHEPESDKPTIFLASVSQIKMAVATAVLFLAACAAPGNPPPEFEPDPDPAIEQLSQRAQEAYELRDLPVAVELYQQLMQRTEDSTAARQAAEISATLEDWDGVDQAVARWLQLEPEAQAPLQFRIIAELRRGRAETAASRFRSELMPRLAAGTVWPTAVALFAAAGDARVAGQALEELLRTEPGPAGFGLLQQSRLAWQLGQQTQALELAQAAFDELGDPASALWLAGIADQLDQPERAMAALRTVRQLGRADAAMVMAEAELLREQGRNEEALALLDTLDENTEVLYIAGALLEDLGRFAAAGATWQRLASLADVADIDRHAWLTGVLAEVLELDREAASWYARVGGAAAAQARLRQAVVLARLGRDDEAMMLLRSLRQQSGTEVLEQTWLIEGQILTDSGHLDRAVALYSDALAELPDSIELLYARAMVAVRAEQLELAEQDLRTIIQRDPENPIALNALGYTLSDRTDRQREALRLIERALALDPENAAILDSMGWVLYRLGQPEAALEWLQKAAEAEAHPEIVAHLVEVLWQLARRDEAMQWVERHRDQFSGEDVFVDTLRRLEIE